jgi:MYXO-CTERM domain-containing protein
MRIAFALATLLVPSVGVAAITPTGVESVAPGSVIAHKNTVQSPSDFRIYSNSPSFQECRVVNEILSCAPSVELSISNGTTAQSVFLVDASSYAGKHVVADACHGRILQASLGAMGNDRTLSPILTEWEDSNNVSIPMQRPAAVAVAPGAAGLIFTEGETPTGNAFNQECLAPEELDPPGGAVVFAQNPWQGSQNQSFVTYLEAGDEEEQVPPDASRATTFYATDTVTQLWVVNGSVGEGDNASRSGRFRSYDLGDGGVLSLSRDWEIPEGVLSELYPDEGTGIGDPIQVAAVTDSSGVKVLLGGPKGIAAFSFEGDYLGPLWLDIDRGEELASASALVSMTHAADGSTVYALFSGGATDAAGNAGEIVAWWDGDSLADLLSRELRVDGDLQTLTTCREADDPEQNVGWRCPTIKSAMIAAWQGQKIEVDSGVYAELAYFYLRPVDLVANGDVTLIAPDESGGVAFDSVRSPGASLEGFVVTGGVGFERQADGHRYGGAVLSSNSEAKIYRSLIVDNMAEYGSAVAMFGSGRVRLENTALVHNRTLTSGVFYATDSNYEPDGLRGVEGLSLEFEHASVGGNCVQDGDGGGLFNLTGTELVVLDSIVANNDHGDTLLVVDSSSGLEVDGSDIYGLNSPVPKKTLEGFGSNNFSADPLFNDYPLYDLTLEANSPARVKGGELGAFGGLDDQLDWGNLEALEPILFQCPNPPGDDDDDATDDDDDSASHEHLVLPSGLSCDCTSDLSGGAGVGLLWLGAFGVTRRRRKG